MARQHIEESTSVYEDIGNSEQIRELLNTLVSLHSGEPEIEMESPSLVAMCEVAERNDFQAIAQRVSELRTGTAD
jgi:hypothetical protein